jgi:hypothetical protein
MMTAESETPSSELERAQLEKAQSDARAAKAAADKAEREEREASDPAAMARRRQTADNDSAKADRDALSSYLPDLGKVTRGGVSVTGAGQPAAGTGVAGVAITSAATRVVAEVVKVLGADDWSLLVTTDADLVSSDAIYVNVRAGLDRLTALANDARNAANAVLAATPRPFAPPLILAAAAQLLPGIISLLSRPTTLTTGEVPFDDLTASIAVAGELKGGNAKRHIFHDQFRLAPEDTAVDRAATDLRAATREELVGLKAQLEQIDPGDDAELKARAAEALALTSQVITGIDVFLQALDTVPTGATRSPRVTAMLQEAIRSGDLPVLLVRAQSASGMQLVANNLVFKDKFSVLAAATISWMLTDQTGQVGAAGLETGTAQAGGSIGDSFSLTK